MKRVVAPFGDDVVHMRLIEERDLANTLAWRNRDDARIWFKSEALIEMQQHRAWFDRYLSRDDDFLFVVEAACQPVGQASVYDIDWRTGRAELGRFLVSPEASRQGYLARACARLVRFCADSFQLSALFLEVKEANDRAIELYRRNDFVECWRERGIIRMERQLTQDHGARTS